MVGVGLGDVAENSSVSDTSPASPYAGAMENEEFLNLAAAVSIECLEPGDIFGNLVLRNGKQTKEFREPQLRHLWARRVDEMRGSGLAYSFEYPTGEKYSFFSKSDAPDSRSGLVDFALYAAPLELQPLPQVLVEFKVGLSAGSIRTDLIKLMRESAQRQVDGCAVMLVKQKARLKDVELLGNNLPLVIRQATNPEAGHISPEELQALTRNTTWFELLLVVRDGTGQGSYRLGNLSISDLLSDSDLSDQLRDSRHWAERRVATAR